MTRTVYFDTSIFFEMANANKKSKVTKDLKELLKELADERVRIYTSIITVQELSVAVYRRGAKSKDTYGDISRLARIYGVTKDVALTAAHREAELKDALEEQHSKSKGVSEEQRLERICENRRRRWDCFHIATAQTLGCTVLYSTDTGMLPRQNQLALKGIRIKRPAPTPATIEGPLFGSGKA